MASNFLDRFYDSSLNRLVPYRSGKFWGFSNLWGELIIEPTYDGVQFFTQMSLDDVQSYQSIVMKNGSYHIIDSKNRRLSASYKEIKCYPPGKTVNGIFIVNSFENLKGIFANNTLIVEPTYNSIKQCDQFLIVKKGLLYGLLDQNGNVVVKVEFENIEYLNSEEPAAVISEWLLTKDGKSEVRQIFNDAKIISQDIDTFLGSISTDVIDIDKYISYIFKNGKVGVEIKPYFKTIEAKYDKIQVAYQSSWASKIVIKDYYHYNEPFLFIVTQNNFLGLIDDDDNELLPIIYDSIADNGYDVFDLKKGSLYGRYNLKNKTKFMCKHRFILLDEIILLNDTDQFYIYKVSNDHVNFDYISENGICYFDN